MHTQPVVVDMLSTHSSHAAYCLCPFNQQHSLPSRNWEDWGAGDMLASWKTYTLKSSLAHVIHPRSHHPIANMTLYHSTVVVAMLCSHSSMLSTVSVHSISHTVFPHAMWSTGVRVQRFLCHAWGLGISSSPSVIFLELPNAVVNAQVMDAVQNTTPTS